MKENIAVEDNSVETDAKGLTYALLDFIDVVGLRMLLTLPGGASLRHLETGDIIGNSPFMDSLIVMIMLLFLISGICFGVGTIIATMIPHTVILFITYGICLV